MAPEPPIRLDELFQSYVVVRSIDPFPFFWIDGRYKRNIRKDRNKHQQSSKAHYHIYGKPRAGTHGKPIGVVREDGTASHGSGPFTLHPDDAEALRREGVPIPHDNIVRWIQFEADWFALIVISTDSWSTSASEDMPL